MGGGPACCAGADASPTTAIKQTITTDRRIERLMSEVAQAGCILQQQVAEGLGAVVRNGRADAPPLGPELAAYGQRGPSEVALQLLDVGQVHQPVAVHAKERAAERRLERGQGQVDGEGALRRVHEGEAVRRLERPDLLRVEEDEALLSPRHHAPQLPASMGGAARLAAACVRIANDRHFEHVVRHDVFRPRRHCDTFWPSSNPPRCMARSKSTRPSSCRYGFTSGHRTGALISYRQGMSKECAGVRGGFKVCGRRWLTTA